MFSEQSQELALIYEDVSYPQCVQQADVLAAKVDRTLAQARSAVASAKQNRSGAFPPSNVPSSRKGKNKGKPRENRKIHRVSSVAEVIISGDNVLNDSRKDLAKEVWNFDSELFETVVLQADVVLDCGATETSGGVEAVQILVDAVTQKFS